MDKGSCLSLLIEGRSSRQALVILMLQNQSSAFRRDLQFCSVVQDQAKSPKKLLRWDTRASGGASGDADWIKYREFF